MRLVKTLFAVTVLAAIGWSGWWVIGSEAKERAFADWLAERRAEGWQAEAASIETRGFPSRFDTRLSDLALADPEQGWAWRTPFLDVMMLSYQPNAAVAALPSGQTIAAPGARTRLDGERMRGSLRFVPGPSLELARLSVEAETVALTADAGWVAAARKLAAHLRAADPATTPEHGYDLYIEADGVRLPAPLKAALDPAGALPDVFDRFVLDGRAALTAPLDRHAVEADFPGARAISLKSAEARWGELALRVKGRIAADAEGYAEGELSVRAENWREMLRAAVRAGALGRELAQALEFGLGLLAGFGGGDDLEAPVVFEDGYARIGPVPVGRAPRIAAPRVGG